MSREGMEALGPRREPWATGAAPAAAGRGKGRWSARRKMTVVLELLRGAELETTSRKYGVTAATLTRWRKHFLRRRVGVEDPSHRRGGRGAQDAEVGGSQPGGGQRAAAGTDSADGGRKAFSTVEVEAMSRTLSPSTGKPYGLARVAAVWDLSRSTYYARRHRRAHPIKFRKRGPRTA